MKKMKKAIIIGATSGIGRGLAEKFINQGYAVGITGRRAHLLDEMKSENPDHYFTKVFDINHELAMDYIQELIDEMGGLDVIVYSSGIGVLNMELEPSIELKTIDVNVSGFTKVVTFAYNFFKKQGHGHIVSISSVAGLRGDSTHPAYFASKSFQSNYLEGLRIKARKTDISITDIRPGYIETDIIDDFDVFWVAPIDKAIKQMFCAIRKRKQVAYISRRWSIMAAFIKMLPRGIYDLTKS